MTEYNTIYNNSMQTEQQYSAFKGLPWFDYISDYVNIGGAGGIGSYLCYFLSRAGFKVHVMDYDIIEKRNLSGQFYKNLDVGLPKTVAIYNTVKEFSPSSSILTSCLRITESSEISGIYFFSAFDNMSARRIFFDLWKKNVEKNIYPGIPIFIDGRLEAEQLQIFCVTKERISQYEEYLFSDSEIEDTACTMKQTSHVAAMIATFMTSFFTNHVTNMVEKDYVRDVPFLFENFVPLTLISRI